MRRIVPIILGITVTALLGHNSLASEPAPRDADVRGKVLTVTGGTLALQRPANDDCDTNGEPEPCDVDCNANNRPDDLDLYMGTSRDCDADRSPDECEDPAPSDLDGDEDVDAADLTIFRECDRTSSPRGEVDCGAADFNEDGQVDCADWQIMHCAWTEGEAPEYRRCPAPSNATSTGE